MAETAVDKWKKVALAVSFTTFVIEDATQRTHTESLIREIEAAEEPIGPTLRYVYLKFVKFLAVCFVHKHFFGRTKVKTVSFDLA